MIVFGAWLVALVIFFITWLLASDTSVGGPCKGAGFGSFQTGQKGIEFLGIAIGLTVTFGRFVLGMVVTSLVGLIKSMC